MRLLSVLILLIISNFLYSQDKLAKFISPGYDLCFYDSSQSKFTNCQFVENEYFIVLNISKGTLAFRNSITESVEVYGVINTEAVENNGGYLLRIRSTTDIRFMFKIDIENDVAILFPDYELIPRTDFVKYPLKRFFVKLVE